MNDPVADYGRLIGRDDLVGAHQGMASQLQWPDGSILEIEVVDEDLLVSLAFSAPHPTTQELLEALRLLDMRQAGAAQPLQVGVVGVGVDARLVVLSRMQARGADGRLIQQHAERCRQWRRRWEATCQRQGH